MLKEIMFYYIYNEGIVIHSLPLDKGVSGHPLRNHGWAEGNGWVGLEPPLINFFLIFFLFCDMSTQKVG
jgi:hypothetical protein